MQAGMRATRPHSPHLIITSNRFEAVSILFIRLCLALREAEPVAPLKFRRTAEQAI